MSEEANAPMTKPANDVLNRILPPDQTIDGTLGVTFEVDEIGVATGRMPVENRVCQPYGIVHGGAYAVLAESVASAATFRAVYEHGKLALGMSNQTQLLRPAREGTVHADAKAIHRGRTTWVWDVTMTNDAGDLCAVSRITVAVRPADGKF